MDLKEFILSGISKVFWQKIFTTWIKPGKAGSNFILDWSISTEPLIIWALFSITNLELLLYIIVFFPFINTLSSTVGFKLRLNLIYWTLLILENDDLINKSSIIASFNKSTISYPLDGSNDINFEMPKKIIDQ